jgi:hypothetical protein
MTMPQESITADIAEQSQYLWVEISTCCSYNLDIDKDTADRGGYVGYRTDASDR